MGDYSSFREENMTDQNFTTEEVFDSAVSIVRNLPKEGSVKPSDELKLKLYALYKQATYGINDTPKPRFYQVIEVYKWDAWRKLGDMSKEEAMLSYIRELKQIMESISEDTDDPEDGKHFEDVLGKKFYDYWFKQWKQSGSKGEQVVNDIGLVKSREGTVMRDLQEMVAENGSNDTHSNSSRCSSMSMLDETQSTIDGYKTPTCLALRGTIGDQVGDQFAAAILRLQKGLEDTRSKVDKIERDVNQFLVARGRLENQTQPKMHEATTTGKDGNIRGSSIWKSSDLMSMLKNFKTIHWFYLSYPFLVYFILRFIDKRREKDRFR